MGSEQVADDAAVVLVDVDDEQKRFFANGLDDSKTTPSDFFDWTFDSLIKYELPEHALHSDQFVLIILLSLEHQDNVFVGKYVPIVQFDLDWNSYDSDDLLLC